MRKRSVILIGVLVMMPLLLLIGAALRLARSEQVILQQQFSQLMLQRLDDVNQSIARHFEETQRQLLRITALDAADTDQLREVNRREPRVLQLFVLTPAGDLRYPDPAQELNSSEQSFLLRAARMFTDRDLRSAVALVEDRQNSTMDDLQSAVPPDMNYMQLSGPTAQASGWFVWYWDRGMNLICWQRRANGEVVGAALERSRWIADLIAMLPETETSAKSADLRYPVASVIRLVDSGGSVIYEWGLVDAMDSLTEPLCELPVAAPLSTWRLQCFVPAADQAASPRGSLFLSLTGGLLAVAVATAVLGIMLFREYAGDMRQAARQVSFVNQVSHELKTPLTNIRLYAELLERDLDALPDELTAVPKQRLDVILFEGQRLSRLIGNVLTFARQNHQTLQLRMQSAVPDKLIRAILDRFRPALEDLKIQVQMDGHAEDGVLLDPDIVEQILGNVISNVEKYAADGGVLTLESGLANGLLTITVQDGGPGIPPRQREQVFLPFVRLCHDISYSAGTGIGLTIARRLARLHGGDVHLLDSDRGCRFQITLNCRITSPIAMQADE